MPNSLPGRHVLLNVAGPDSAACAAFLVLASRPIGADGCLTILRGEVRSTFTAARRHALRVLDVIADRYGAGIAVDVQVLDAGNCPVFICTAGGDL